MKPLLARSHHYDQLLQSPPAKKKQNRAAPRPRPPPRWRRPPKARRARRSRSPDVLRERVPARQVLRQDAVATAHREFQEGRCRMARWGKHRDRVEAAQRRITVEHGYIDLSLPALVRAGRAARAVPTSAAERVANLKGPGPSTARRDAIHYHSPWCSGRRRRRTSGSW
jgi:hypothetical protein